MNRREFSRNLWVCLGYVPYGTQLERGSWSQCASDFRRSGLSMYVPPRVSNLLLQVKQKGCTLAVHGSNAQCRPWRLCMNRRKGSGNFWAYPRYVPYGTCFERGSWPQCNIRFWRSELPKID